MSVMQFKPFIEQVLDIYPLIDYAILLGTGGMKVLYSDVSRTGRTKDLALNYISQHTVIKPTGNEMCSRNNFMPVSTVSELQWDMEHWQKAPDILLVEAACCFEEGGNLYAENKASLISTLSKRIQGLSGTIRGLDGDPVKAPVKLTVGSLVFYTKLDGYYYIWLSPGVHTIDVHKEGYYPYSFSAKIVLSKQAMHDILLTESFAFSSLFKRENLSISFIAFCMLALIFIGLYRLSVVHRIKSIKRWGEGFERLPLNDFDSNASDDDVVLDSTKYSFMGLIKPLRITA
ncbi:hypothetical protein WUBG_11996 [Wuchereria bancrofti]|nr:hypothetical protein WUBG_11996 [Wuchereria bancrofti]